MMMMSKTQQDISRERDQRSNITRNNNNSTYTNKSSVKAKKWSICKERRILEVKSIRIDSNLQIYICGRPTKNGALEKRVGLSTIHGVLSEEM
jgi:hypothetical protein